jgi:hypothetical protein
VARTDDRQALQRDHGDDSRLFVGAQRASRFGQQILTVDYQAAGTCSGTLDGQSLSSAPVAMHNHAKSDGSCLHAQTLAPGPGSLHFENGPTIYYTMEFTHVFSDGVASYHGQKSGEATGRETFLTPRTPPDISVHCYDGAGISDIPMDLTLATQSPLTSSGRTHGNPGHGGHGDDD